MALISHANKIMLKILKARLYCMWIKNLQMYQSGLKRGRGTRNHIANICWITKKAREFQNYIYFCFIDYTKAFDYVGHNKLAYT